MTPGGSVSSHEYHDGCGGLCVAGKPLQQTSWYSWDEPLRNVLGMIVRGRMEQISEQQHRLTHTVKQGIRSVDLFFLKSKDFDLLDRATQQSITELQA